MKFSGLYSSLILTIQKLVLLMTHLTGTSTYVRVGGSYVDNNTQPGLFSADHEEEYSAASHGEGTEYCGRIFYRSSNSPATILMSRGIGTHTSALATVTYPLSVLVTPILAEPTLTATAPQHTVNVLKAGETFIPTTCTNRVAFGVLIILTLHKQVHSALTLVLLHTIISQEIIQCYA